MESQWKRRITVVWIGQSVSLLSSTVLQMCLIWYLTFRTQSASIVTLATLAGFLPQALLGPLVGAVIDRFPKKQVIILADCAVACTSLVLAYFTAQGELPVPLILFLLVLRSLGTAFHEPTVQAITPLLVPQSNLTQYAGFAQAFETVSMLLSPALSVVLYEAWDLEYIILLDVLGAFLAVGCLLCVPLPKEDLVKKQENKMQVWAETKEGLDRMGQIPGIFSLMLIGFLYTILYSPIGSLYPHITLVYFGGSTQDSAFVEVVFSTGTLLGALILGKVGSKLNKRLGLFGSIFGYGCGACAIGFLPNTAFWSFVVISFFMGITIPFYHGVSRAIYQLKIPQEYLGRAFALAQSSRRLGMPLGLLIGGQFADGIGVDVLYRLAGGGAMVLALWGLRLKEIGDK